jgi:hypothetical protein
LYRDFGDARDPKCVYFAGVRRRLILLAAAALLAGAAAGPAAALRTGDPLQGKEWFLSAVGADQASPPGPGIPLTLVDSGLDGTQPDFAGRPDTTYLNAQTVTGAGEFHGTEIASVAAAPANGTGIVGIYPQAKLAIWDATSSPGSIQPIAGVTAAPCPGVINLSFGATQPDPKFLAAIVAAQQRGCLVVAAAGNDAASGNPTIYPAAFPHVLAVGASDEAGAIAPFSSTGPWVDLFAPGVGIETDTTLEHDPSGTIMDEGTSFSAAIVASAAAWVWTVRPKLSAAQVFALIKSTTQNGILNIPAALSAPTPPNDPFEPNDTLAEAAAQKALRLPLRITGTLDAVKDPADFYRIVLPKKKHVRLSVTGNVFVRMAGTYARLTLRPGAASARYTLSVRAG